jgi:hypothetical protein
VQLLKKVFAATANLDELIDQVEILDHECCAWMLQVLVPVPWYWHSLDRVKRWIDLMLDCMIAPTPGVTR